MSKRKFGSGTRCGEIIASRVSIARSIVVLVSSSLGYQPYLSCLSASRDCLQQRHLTHFFLGSPKHRALCPHCPCLDLIPGLIRELVVFCLTTVFVFRRNLGSNEVMNLTFAVEKDLEIW
jgi:hypothetical protein